jgi:hypothetical protein
MRSGVITSRVILAGAIAGFISGIAAFLAVQIGPRIGLFYVEMIPLSIEFLLTQLPAQLSYNTIWGIIFGIAFAIVYDCIPGKGVMKGLFFAMIYFFLFSNVRSGAILATWAYTDLAIGWIWVGFFCALAWGLVMGALYKK